MWPCQLNHRIVVDQPATSRYTPPDFEIDLVIVMASRFESSMEAGIMNIQLWIMDRIHLLQQVPEI
jgi:hypothetical protein